jgi:hypothetical protein
MKISFRQGIVSAYMAGVNPQFLQQSTTAGYVSFTVAPTPTVVAFAHGSSDYLQVFSQDVDMAWGPIQSGVTSYLYWEIVSKVASWKPEVYHRITTLAPTSGPTAPTNPANDQHWFDTASTTMKVWNGTKWDTKIAVFAGTVPGGIITSRTYMPIGMSQVGLNVPSDPGYIMLDSQQRPIRANTNLEFLTTTSPVRIQTTSGTSGILAIPPNAFIPVKASENIPQFSLVYFSGPDAIGLASSNPALVIPKIPIGVVQEDLDNGEFGVVTQHGEIQWDQWDWSAHIGKPLYCGNNGEITPVRPNGLQAFRIGFVKNANTILFGIDSETQPQIYQANANSLIINGVSPVFTSFATNSAGERIWSVEIQGATAVTDGYMSIAQVLALEDHGTRITNVESILPGKANVVHTHVAANITDLAGLLAAKSNIGHNHDLLYSALNHDHNLVYSLLGHQHPINDVSGLQDALNNLQTMIGNKADLAHTHVMADVTGLTGALAGKSAVGHTHVMADVAGLTAALVFKSDITHTHTLDSLSDVDAATPSTGQALAWDGTNWVPRTVATTFVPSLLTSNVFLTDPPLPVVTHALYFPFDFSGPAPSMISSYLDQYAGVFATTDEYKCNFGALNQANAGAQVAFIAPAQISFTGPSGSVVGSNPVPASFPKIAIFEVTIFNSASLSIGVIKPSNYTDPNVSYAKSIMAVTYSADGTIAFNENGALTTVTVAPYANDTIGVAVYQQGGGYGDTYVKFFKNGSVVYTTPLLFSLGDVLPLITTFTP